MYKISAKNELDEWLKKMDKDNKVGWNREEFLKLNFNDKLAFAVGRFVGQSFNNGVDGFIYNGYDYLIGFLRSEVAETLDQEWLEDFWEEWDELHRNAEYGEWTEDEYNAHIEILNEELWSDRKLDRLKGKAIEYLENQEYEHLHHIKSHKILCPNCKQKGKTRSWNALTLIKIKKHNEIKGLTPIKEGIKNDRTGLQYRCPNCKKMINIDDIKKVNTYE